MSRITKKFNGKVYYLETVFISKSSARDAVKRHRKRGYYARIYAPNQFEHQVYIRKK